jgi:hypothetical protein
VVIAALIAAFIAVFTNYQSQRATNVQLRIAEQGQITDRYNAAVTNLGSRSIEIRLGGIYALQRLMKDSPRDQSTVIAVLCAFVRDQTAPAVKPRKPPPSHVPTDVQAALTVVGTRNTANDGPTTVVDLDHAQLRNAQLRWLDLTGADLTGADLTRADLQRTNLTSADLTSANLSTCTAPRRTSPMLTFSRRISPARTSPAQTSPTRSSSTRTSLAWTSLG